MKGEKNSQSPSFLNGSFMPYNLFPKRFRGSSLAICLTDPVKIMVKKLEMKSYISTLFPSLP